MESFNNFNIPQWLKDSLGLMGYTAPTPIQQQAIPSILDGADVLGSAQTGTGKTGAFLVPLLNFLNNNTSETALILTPTRELAIQVNNVAMQMLKTNKKIRTALLIGGDPIAKQFFQLKQKPRLIVGTPGRINDHLIRKSVDLSKTSFVVLDETDRMLDMGFGIQIDEIFKYVAAKKQTLLFSATLPKEIIKLVDNYLIKPVRVSAGEVNTVATKVSQKIIKTKDKYSEVLKLIPELNGTTLIFVRTQRGAESMTANLKQQGLKVEAIHGGLKQGKRTNVLRNFRSKRFNILVATDVASRGLDIDHIENVINYDIPDNPEDYIHRIGRTARGDKEGSSYSFVSPSEEVKWRAVQRFLDPEAYKKEKNLEENNNKWKPYKGNNFNKNKPNNGYKSNKRKHDGEFWHHSKPKHNKREEGEDKSYSKSSYNKPNKPWGEKSEGNSHHKPNFFDKEKKFGNGNQSGNGNRKGSVKKEDNISKEALSKIKNIFSLNKKKDK
ncbi:MAG: DEAD/DEAH box helicase [Alphaproteobacteria bacterium]|nr:DEAD/DEAH box helicase [Alphaproteobacteria bacterium]